MNLLDEIELMVEKILHLEAKPFRSLAEQDSLEDLYVAVEELRDSLYTDEEN